MNDATKVNILCISRASGPQAGGMERLNYEMIEALSLEPDLHVETLVYQQPARQSLAVSHFFSALFAMTCLPRALTAARQADIVHLGDPLLSFAGFCIKKFIKKPVVVTVHGLDVTYQNPLYRLYLKLFFRHFAGYIAISEYARQKLDDWHVAGKTIVISPGIHDRYFGPRTRQELSQLLKQNTEGKIVFFTAGRLIPRKGHIWFIEHVLPQLPSPVLYVIAGEGSERTHIINTAEKNDVAGQVILLGKVSEEHLRILYNTADAFIQPNTKIEGDIEGFGLVLTEAALCERPVFAANIDGIPSAIHDGKSGTLLPAQNAQKWTEKLNNFITHREKYREHATSARQYTLQNFAWPHITKRYKQFFASL